MKLHRHLRRLEIEPIRFNGESTTYDSNAALEHA